MKQILLFLFIISLWGCQAQEKTRILKTVNYDELKSIIQKEDGKLYIVNFWATWCKPCVEELPSFMAVNEQFKNESNFKMILVSMDNAKVLETKVKNFIQKNNMDVDVYLLDDNKRMNEWIPAVDEKWSGIIPATVVYKNGKKILFHEKQMTQFELEDIVNENL